MLSNILCKITLYTVQRKKTKKKKKKSKLLSIAFVNSFNEFLVVDSKYNILKFYKKQHHIYCI